ncbi:MAG: N-acetyl-gamma-glutamyl-phosphate reductase [Eubacterium sp.]|nr:N-acetyl-gamma-glutamyl-phosphate reductase [Eubacterium sp.]
MSIKVYIDGQEGTTGLKISERFENRTDIELLKIDEDKRKDEAERKKLINASDYTFLCLPDDAARQAVALAGEDVRIIDASTAHRTNPDWAYGFPELSAAHREKIANSNRVAVPGCYASGFISLVYPLVSAGVMPADYPVTVHAVSGYSGAGKKGIAQYEDANRDAEFDSPREYALTQQHKHLPEMRAVTGLDYDPIFCPYVCDYYSGMTVTVPVASRLLNKYRAIYDVHKVIEEHYAEQKLVKVMPLWEQPSGGFLAANTLSGRNDMEIYVFGNDDRILLCSRFDNLGKGASGAAVQCLNIMCGVDETTGLV